MEQGSTQKGRLGISKPTQNRRVYDFGFGREVSGLG